MLNEVQRPAQLAAAAARASANGTTAVMFTVRMSKALGLVPAADEAGCKDDPRRPGPGGAEASARTESVLATVMAREELLFFSSGDVEFHVTTRGTSDRKVTDLPVEATMIPVSPPDGLVMIEGRATLNPGFLYEAAHQLEVMLVFGARPWAPTVTESLITTVLARELAQLVVAEAAAPILFMHLPAAPYREPSGHERGDGSLEALRDTHALCLRMSLALAGEQTDARLRFLERLGRAANDWGVGLHVGDRRPGKIRGEWITVRQFDADRFRQKAEEDISEVNDDIVTHGQPVTIVGPARVGSSLAIFRALAQHGVGLVNLSVTAMQEVAFINFTALTRIDGDAPRPVGAFPLRVGLQHLIRACGVGVDTNVRDWDLGDTRAAADYYVLIGTAYPVVVDDVNSPRPRPLWITWDVPFGGVDLDDVLVYLTKSLDEQNVVHVLQYGRARLAGDGRIRGRAKVGVELAGSPRTVGPRKRLRQLCTFVEDSIRADVARQANLNDSEVRIRVMWRERWLGKWESPL